MVFVTTRLDFEPAGRPRALWGRSAGFSAPPPVANSSVEASGLNVDSPDSPSLPVVAGSSLSPGRESSRISIFLVAESEDASTAFAGPSELV